MKFITLKDAVDFTHLEEQHIDGTDDRNPHQSWLKAMFRKDPIWKSFCEQLISKREHCERCGGDGKDCSGLQVHHRNPKDYTDLKEENFSVLCGRCHLTIESFCLTEEKMKQCPNVDKRFLTLYPYKQKDEIVLAKGSGKFQIRRWTKELKVTREPEKWINGEKTMTGAHKKEVQDAVSFMKQHKELF
jgi:hypothetical protein